MMCFCMQIFITYIPAAHTYHAIHTVTVPNIACHACHAIHTMPCIQCHRYKYYATHTMLHIPRRHTLAHIPCRKYHSTHTRLLDTCHPTHAMPHIPCHTYHAIHTMPYIHTYKQTHIPTYTPHTDICAYLRAYMRMYFWCILTYCTNVVATLLQTWLLANCNTLELHLKLTLSWVTWAVSKTNKDTSSWFWGSLVFFCFIHFLCQSTSIVSWDRWFIQVARMSGAMAAAMNGLTRACILQHFAKVRAIWPKCFV